MLHMELKLCGTCKKEKSIDDFTWKNKEKGLKQSYCKTCKKTYQDKWYAKNRVERNKKAREYELDRKKENYEKLWEYFKQNPCIDCGETDPIVLQLDHVRGEKKFEVSQKMKTMIWETLSKEIKKCEVVCANCHFRRTAKTHNWYSWLR